MAVYKIVLLLLAACIVVPAKLNDCIARDYGNDGTVCVCNATYCDYIPPVQKVNGSKVLIYTSNQKGLRFKMTTGVFKNDKKQNVDIEVMRQTKYQNIQGFGGAFTDSTGINIKSVTDAVQNKILDAYFSNNGIEYNLCRVPIGGTDFSLEAYTYDDGPSDPELKRFNLSHYDKEYKIPFIKKAQKLTNGKLKLFSSTWGAPEWMKTNNNIMGGAIKYNMYQVWANYYVKFFDAYKSYGIEFCGVTTGNEPSLAVSPLILLAHLPSVGWNTNTMARWVGQFLGPTLKKHGYGKIKIMCLDDQRYFIPWFVEGVLRDNLARKYISGTAVHWYFDKIFPPTLLSFLHDKYPDKFILSTEASEGSLFWNQGVALGSWKRAEDYAADIMQNLQNWVVGWVDWNMVLNASGGPTYINNYVDSPIIVNASANEFYKQPMFYALGHFSKFIPRDSRVIGSSQTNKVSSIAVLRPDNGITVVLLNRNTMPVSVTIYDKTKGKITLDISSHSITSVLYW